VQHCLVGSEMCIRDSPQAESASKLVSADTKKGAMAPFHSSIGS
jgi:hypothetical protein